MEASILTYTFTFSIRNRQRIASRRHIVVFDNRYHRGTVLAGLIVCLLAGVARAAGALLHTTFITSLNSDGAYPSLTGFIWGESALLRTIRVTRSQGSIMALSPIIKATVQSAVLGGIANILAQFFRSYRLDV